MAEIMSSLPNGPGRRHALKKVPRVDLTPMVDLGFLLITFFIFTTTMAQPKLLTLNMPYTDSEVFVPPSEVKESTALTIILKGKHQLYYYEGSGKQPGVHLQQATWDGEQAMRDVIISKKKQVAALVRNGQLKANDKLTVLIKPDATAVYDDLVRVLDEMSVNDVAVYAIVAIDSTDRGLMAAGIIR